MSNLTVADLVDSARASVEELDPDQVQAELARGATLIDLREPEERTTNGVIEGAVHIPRGMVEFRADPATPYYNPVFQPAARTILHCASGGRSALAAVALKSMGYTNIAHLAGGLNAWKAAGKPVA